MFGIFLNSIFFKNIYLTCIGSNINFLIVTMAATKNASFATSNALIASVVTSLSANIYHPIWLATMNAGTNICIRFRPDPLPSVSKTNKLQINKFNSFYTVQQYLTHHFLTTLLLNNFYVLWRH